MGRRSWWTHWLRLRLVTGARPGDVAGAAAPPLPTPPDDSERVLYLDPGPWLLMHAPAVIGFVLALGLLGFSVLHVVTWPLVPWLAISVAYWAAICWVTSGFRRFDLEAHEALVTEGRKWPAPSVDVFLPSCGEPLDLIENTFTAVAALEHDGPLNVYCLDDARSSEVERLARRFGFEYFARPDQRVMAKAGNIRYAYLHTSGDFIAIFDADFCPRPGFLAEVLPYALADPKIGVVQSPQFFRVSRLRNWLQNGSASLQENFYRVFMPSREARRCALCVGTNAVYRRSALQLTDGPALVPYSEDVHTGFDLHIVGYRIKYIPVVLAAGLCPDTIGSLISQQYRWCSGAVGLCFSRKFWGARLDLRTRLVYLAGFSYFVQSSLTTLLGPLPAVVMIWVYPHHFKWWSLLLFIPIAHQVVSFFGCGRRTPSSLSGMRSNRIYGWAHVLAIRDMIGRRTAAWVPTGAERSHDRIQQTRLRAIMVVYGSLAGAAMIAGAVLHGATASFFYSPIVAFGAINLSTSLAILIPLHHERPQKSPSAPAALAVARSGNRA